MLANRAYRELVRAGGGAVPVELGLEQADGSVFRFSLEVLPEAHAQAGGNFTYVERLVKFLLWSRGGFRIYFSGPPRLGEALQRHYREAPTGKFDSDIIGSRIYDRPIEVALSREIPPRGPTWLRSGRIWTVAALVLTCQAAATGKVAAVIDGKVVFSEEVVWDPVRQSDPQYHYDGVMDSLKRAAQHLPRVDAIGGSSATAFTSTTV